MSKISILFDISILRRCRFAPNGEMFSYPIHIALEIPGIGGKNILPKPVKPEKDLYIENILLNSDVKELDSKKYINYLYNCTKNKLLYLLSYKLNIQWEFLFYLIYEYSEMKYTNGFHFREMIHEINYNNSNHLIFILFIIYYIDIKYINYYINIEIGYYKKSLFDFIYFYNIHQTNKLQINDRIYSDMISTHKYTQYIIDYLYDLRFTFIKWVLLYTNDYI